MSPLRFSCTDVDELAGALALFAVEADEARAAREHLETCREPHAELRELLGADAVLSAGLEPIEPSTGLRDRLMASVAAMPRASPAPPASPGATAELPPRSRWLDWLSPQVARPVALAAVAALVAVGIWGVTLSGQLADRDRQLRDVAAAISGGEVAFRVEGSAGRGYVVDTPGSGASLVVADVGPIPTDRVYELWLIGPSGPVDVGTFRPGADALSVVRVDRDLSGFDTFAVTVEAQRVSAPTTDPVMAGALAS